MSDSSDDNLSELEEEQIPDGGGSDDEGDGKPELKGILDDVEETNVSWKDLVSLSAGAWEHMEWTNNLFVGTYWRSVWSLRGSKMENSVEDSERSDTSGT